MEGPALIRGFKVKVLVFIKPPSQSNDHVKSKKRWDPTVDHFYFHHWFRTSNVFSNEHESKSSVSRCQERPWTRQSQPPWVRRGCGWRSCRPRPSHRLVLQKCICSLLFHSGKEFACFFFNYIMKNYIHFPLESPCARLQLEDNFFLNN